MKVRRFQAKTFGEALALVRRELGEDAVILSSEERKGKGQGVEVSAAVDYDLAASSFSQAAAPPRRPGRASSHASSADSVALREVADTLAQTIRTELRSLRALVEEAFPNGGPALAPQAGEVLRFLEEKGIRREHALRLCSGSGTPAGVLARMVSELAVRDPKAGGRRAVMLVGPTGVGKTTTVAKLAAAAAGGGRRAALVSLDTYRIGAIEQVRIFARILGIPLSVARDAGEVREIFARHSDCDVLFIDTTGRNPSTGTFLAEVASVYEAGVPVETHLVLSANSDYDFLAETCRRFGKLPVDFVGITKADEAVRRGAIYNIFALCRKPVAYVTTGQTVPCDIEFPTRERLAALILSRDPFRKAARSVA